MKKRKYKAAFLLEVDRFDRCNTASSPGRTDLGIEQFFRKESLGEEPKKPDPYYIHLVNGKKWWEWTINSIADTYLTEEWQGWYAFAIDFKDDPSGFKQLRARCGQTRIDPSEIISMVENDV